MFNKLFTKILDSSIWLEPTETRIVWITLLAAMDEDGYAHFSAMENLASRARVTMEQAEAAVKCLMAPDPNSGNPDHEGRRIERVPGGFIILNAERHRGIMNRVIEREQTRIRVARYRQKKDATPDESQANGTYHQHSRIALAWLNEKCGRHYRETDSNLKLISARLSEKDVTIDGVKMMIDRQVARWLGTPQEEYLRPETLFGKSKFDGYYAAKDLAVVADGKSKPKPEANQIQEQISVKSL